MRRSGLRSSIHSGSVSEIRDDFPSCGGID
jgi:hypothetical protein